MVVKNKAMDYAVEIIKQYKEKKLSAAFCCDLSIHLEDKGFKKTDGFSIYSNWFCRKNLPKEIIKLKFIHEFIINYDANDVRCDHADSDSNNVPKTI